LFYEQLVERISGIDEDIEKNKTAWKHEVQSEIAAAFEDLHYGILGAIARSPEGVMKSTGTTATVLFITNKAVILANVGDSRAIISNGISAPTQLSIDHVASNKEEQERIESLGGFVSSVGGTPRVNGTLAVSRSLGDAHLASLLSRKPHVVAMSRDEIRQYCKTSEDARNYSTGSDDISSPCFMVIACKYRVLCM
jgi:protein phosphatase 1L